MIVNILRFDHFGRGVGYIDSKVCFVEGALPGEEVEIEIYKERKNYIYAKTIRIIKKSPIRIDSNCPYSDECGGCNFQNISYEDEINYKNDKINDILCRYGGLNINLIKPILYNNDYNYRNKIILHGKDGVLGLYQESTHTIVPIDKCILVDNKINSIIKILNTINKNITNVLIQSSNDSNYVLVSIIGEVSSLDELKNNCDVLIYNNELISKDNDIISSIGNKKYHVSAGSFFQVNRSLTKVLYDYILDIVEGIKPNKALDLYCGTGTIGIYVSDYCNEITGIDYNHSNIEDANKNKDLNNVKNIKFICSKVEKKIGKFQDIDLVIVDPPRAGLDPITIMYLNDLNTKTIIYVSCNPITLGRDIKDLSKSYNVLSVQPFNMFPKTYHVECVCVLELK